MSVLTDEVFVQKMQEQNAALQLVLKAVEKKANMNGGLRLLIPKPYAERDTVNDDIYVDSYTRVYGSLISGTNSNNYPIKFYVKKSLFNFQKYNLSESDTNATKLIHIRFSSVVNGTENSYFSLNTIYHTQTHYCFQVGYHYRKTSGDLGERQTTVSVYLQE